MCAQAFNAASRTIINKVFIIISLVSYLTVNLVW